MDSKPSYTPTTAPASTPNYATVSVSTHPNYSSTVVSTHANYSAVSTHAIPNNAPATVAPLPYPTKTIDRRERKEKKERPTEQKRERKDCGVGTSSEQPPRVRETKHRGGEGAERRGECEERRGERGEKGERRGEGGERRGEGREKRERKDKGVGGEVRKERGGGGRGMKDRRDVLEQGDELTIKLLQEIERRQERHVPQSREIEEGPEKELDFPPSDQESMCDCPAHIHDRESPLLLAQDDFSSTYRIPQPETGTSYNNYSDENQIKKWSL